ncbi:MAG: carboxylate-amine ligase [Candidatus Sedimenticola endophacoides]|uniref:Putative glutamate--cysteine ligase 2 n=1 Tax=Candidatus Sedimenticola endophacoides TaxID=2548426 RepID=A0A6N4DFX0_9GAMM|nr:MAG: carboxylate-amine ligase [Candidatus Sedimenticola endophacoides]OQX38121.1 MAG: carboxylate-amine ligase [Candidatus Sedimenticola endophacoides]OQX41408.1 MAG: carboxylate-amine ligase [Candidatus Sedimenticola endophacoides]PUD98759.1 MAG: carboxylate-amine ligase [Candidatus Sedimenticola endophacoides]PUE01765.1 MAG: carboxylate-amine ligase [Candidatus Sedimenticola endophacoides]
MKTPSFTIGIEEEYLLVDRSSRDLISEAPASMLAECEALLQGQVAPEFLQCQIEVGTRVCGGLHEARDELAYLRRTVATVAERHGLAVIAASTHPFASPSRLEHTPRERYDQLAHDLQEVVRQLVISGMHIHVGIEDDDLRVDLMGQLTYVLPHLLALSTSSPFWLGRDTGLKSYRIAIWDGMPRTGLPESFDSHGEYQRHIDVLTGAGVIEDATKIWWDIRPSDRYPTLEMRITDVCTRLDDAIAVAAFYLCWLRMLYRLRRGNQRWRRYSAFLINENRWRAHRYGIDEGLLDFGRGEIIPFAELIEEAMELIEEDAEFFGCTREIGHLHTILTGGTSAHRQLAAYQRALAEGADREAALRAVVDLLVEETLRGTDPPPHA